MNFNQCSSKGQSADDKIVLSILNDTIKHIGDRYQIGLPWKKDITLPNNYSMAKVQWHALQQRLERDTNLRDRYEETIKKDLDKNYITTADPSCRHSVWYLPHHSVINKQKPDKIRRVTNAASKYKGISLNDALLTGPELLYNLHGLLLRFRQYSVVITADIEAMFMQIGIQPQDQDYLRFLWTEVAIVYVRTTNADGSCTSQYVTSKTKVAPIKQLNIPKLELEAATLGQSWLGSVRAR